MKMMFPFNEMREYARKVDDGIDYLQASLINPHTLTCVTKQSALVAEQTLDQISNDLLLIADSVDHIYKDQQEHIEENTDTIDSAEDFLSEMDDVLNQAQATLKQFNIEPFSKVSMNYEPSSMLTTGSENNSNKNFLEESLVFSSPNYNSTPDSFSCANSRGYSSRRNEDKHLLSSNQRSRSNHCSTGNGRFFNCSSNIGDLSGNFSAPMGNRPISNRSTLRNYNPASMLPQSGHEKKINNKTKY